NCSSYIPLASPCTKTVFSQGIFSGYRYYDRERLKPEFPFGFGLSYTTFRFSGIRVRRSHGGVNVTFSVSNTGRRAGADVAQVYVGPGPSRRGVQQAVRALRGFARVALGAGRARRVTIHLDARSFQYWGERGQRWKTDRGRRAIWVGDADARGHLQVHAAVRIGGR